MAALTRASRVIHLWSDLYVTMKECGTIVWEDPGFGRGNSSGIVEPISLKVVHSCATNEIPCRLRRNSKVVVQVETMEQAEELRDKLISITQQEKYLMGERKGDETRGIKPIPPHPYKLRVKVLQTSADLVLSVRDAKSTISVNVLEIKQTLDAFYSAGYEILHVEEKEQEKELKEFKKNRVKILNLMIGTASESEIVEFEKDTKRYIAESKKHNQKMLWALCKDIAERKIMRDMLNNYIEQADIKDNDKLTSSRYMAKSFRFTYFDCDIRKRRQINAGDICICVTSDNDFHVVEPQLRSGRSDADMYDDIIVDVNDYIGTIRDINHRNRKLLHTYDSYDKYIASMEDEIEKIAKKIAKQKDIQLV